mmetsp:Transcript_58547/g.128381  ORF Transcript_58547/g.128381 Transcript_58547/m.128381 type:complete len:294 (-) Transcript_58547:29-910(-)
MRRTNFKYQNGISSIRQGANDGRGNHEAAVDVVAPCHLDRWHDRSKRRGGLGGLDNLRGLLIPPMRLPRGDIRRDDAQRHAGRVDIAGVGLIFKGAVPLVGFAEAAGGPEGVQHSERVRLYVAVVIGEGEAPGSIRAGKNIHLSRQRLPVAGQGRNRLRALRPVGKLGERGCVESSDPTTDHHGPCHVLLQLLVLTDLLEGTNLKCTAGATSRHHQGGLRPPRHLPTTSLGHSRSWQAGAVNCALPRRTYALSTAALSMPPEMASQHLARSSCVTVTPPRGGQKYREHGCMMA